MSGRAQNWSFYPWLYVRAESSPERSYSALGVRPLGEKLN